MAKILIAEDDKQLNKIICDYVKSAGHDVMSCLNGKEALIKLESFSADVVITDIMMPETDGFSLAEAIRSEDKKVPILFMSARDDKFSKQLGFRIGIDDYVVKPFDLDELLMRVGALLRRAGIEENKILTVGNLTINKEEHTAVVNGEELPLTVREFDILFKFLSRPKKTYTRSSLMEEFWGFDSSSSSRSVDVCMAKIREKTAICDGFTIITVHGLGYKAVLNEEK